jgi:hypothetical protein
MHKEDDTMKKTVWLAIAVVLLFAGCYIVPVQQETPQPPPQPREWQPVTLRATGQGAPPANAINTAQARIMTERAAKLDAYRNLLEQAYGVNISSRSYVRDFVLKNDSIKARVDAYIRGARVTHTVYHDDGGVEVDMEVTLRQDFRHIFPE